MNQGFTLIEALVALIVITLIATVALETQMTTLKLEQAARDTQALRFAISQTLSASRIIPMETLLAAGQSTNGPIHIQVSALTLPDKPAPNQWLKWELYSFARPTLKAEVFTRPNEP
ncbi:MAG: type II secretion system GspH family protein [Verrucomicrobia bacterium]|nr:type II secretion system GspH family protein [Verrucomicrobiota bacterium]MBU1735495.1 type II secretion system GspH family protein [Verrucomicrobiota bacterium]MBU1856890.1 type II secretion system GspH family protein [Verrucomicrobiota bacterium]